MTDDKNIPPSLLDQHLKFLKLYFMRDQHQDLAAQASKQHWSHLDYLEKLAEGEAALRQDRSIQRRRLLHHAETVLVEGKSYRMKDQIQN